MHVRRRLTAMMMGVVVVLVLATVLAGPVHAAISTTGDVDPADPATWTVDTIGYIANAADGTMTITNGSDVVAKWGYIANAYNTTGHVTVDGPGSTWRNQCDAYGDGGELHVGTYGNGTLEITNGGAVSDGRGIIGSNFLSTGEVTVDGAGSQWNSGDLEVGRSGRGTLIITNGGTVSNATGYIDYFNPSLTSQVTVDGAGSTWANNNGLSVGTFGNGILNVTNGGTVSSGNYQRGYSSRIGQYQGSTGEVKVDGAGSTWTNWYHLYVGRDGSSGTLEISNGGLVSVAGILTIDFDLDGDGFINMATGGMLALYGDAGDSLLSFLNLIDGTDAIRYWDDSIADWADITGAIYGDDYTLSYLSEGDLAGYTLLTVPEPATIVLVGLASVGALRRKRS